MIRLLLIFWAKDTATFIKLFKIFWLQEMNLNKADLYYNFFWSSGYKLLKFPSL